MMKTIRLGLDDLEGKSPAYKESGTSALEISDRSTMHSSLSRILQRSDSASLDFQLITPDSVSRPELQYKMKIPNRLDCENLPS